uniref:Uncharacterized protein n=1 Tax=Pectinophora gossypiella TaxID=13191 RepID=A0A1E1VYW6_PECGO
MPMLPHFIKGLQDIFTPSRPSSPNSRQLNITTTLTEHEVLKNLRMCDKKAKSALEELHAQHKVTDQSHIFKLSSEACDSFVNTDPNYEMEGFDPDFDDAVYNPMDQASSACLKDFENKTRVMHHQQSIQDTLIQAIQGDCNPLDASILTLMSDWDKMLDVSKLDSLHDIYIRFINYIGKDSLSYKSDLTQAIITGHNGAFQFLKGFNSVMPTLQNPKCNKIDR